MFVFVPPSFELEKDSNYGNKIIRVGNHWEQTYLVELTLSNSNLKGKIISFELERDSNLKGKTSIELERDSNLKGKFLFELEKDSILKGKTSFELERDSNLKGKTSFELERDSNHGHLSVSLSL